MDPGQRVRRLLPRGPVGGNGARPLGPGGGLPGQRGGSPGRPDQRHGLPSGRGRVICLAGDDPPAGRRHPDGNARGHRPARGRRRGRGGGGRDRGAGQPGCEQWLRIGRFGFASPLPRPATSTWAVLEPRCTTGSSPGTTVEHSSFGSRTPTGSAPPKNRYRASRTCCGGWASTGTKDRGSVVPTARTDRPSGWTCTGRSPRSWRGEGGRNLSSAPPEKLGKAGKKPRDR